VSIHTAPILNKAYFPEVGRVGILEILTFTNLSAAMFISKKLKWNRYSLLVWTAHFFVQGIISLYAPQLVKWWGY
jgi:hypothetical protein